MRSALKAIWKLSFGPAYERLFRRWFRAMLSRQETTLGHIGALQAEVAELRRAVAAELARGEALRLQVRDLDVQVRNALAARWDDAALTRRMVALEDRLRDGEEPIATLDAAASDQVPARPTP